MRLGMILESLDTIHVLLMGSNASCLFTETEKKALNEVKEILKNREAEKGRIIKALEEKGLDDSAGGSGMIWVADAIEIVKRGGNE